MIDINYYAVLVCAVLSMVVGSIWYGPLFGKKWMQIIGATNLDKEKRKEMQKRAMPLYIVQFALSLVQVFVLSVYMYVGMVVSVNPIIQAVVIWLAFIMPTVAGSSMWNNNPAKVKWAMFLIQAGYQLVLFIIFGAVLGFWQ